MDARLLGRKSATSSYGNSTLPRALCMERPTAEMELRRGEEPGHRRRAQVERLAKPGSACQTGRASQASERGTRARQPPREAVERARRGNAATRSAPKQLAAASWAAQALQARGQVERSRKTCARRAGTAALGSDHQRRRRATGTTTTTTQIDKMPRKGAQAKAFAAQQAKKREQEKQEARERKSTRKEQREGHQ